MKLETEMSAGLQSLKMLQDETTAAAKGIVADGTLYAFADDLSAQNAEDVLNSTLLAQQTADKKYNRESQINDWYRLYIRKLVAIGWVTTGFNFGVYEEARQRFTMDEVALEIIGSAIGAALIPDPARAVMLKVAGDAVAALKSRKEPLRLFERQTKRHRGGDFRIATCTQSEGGRVVMALGAVNFSASSSVTNVLFWEWASAAVDVSQGQGYMTLNTSIYPHLREEVLKQLIANGLQALEEFEI